MTLTSLYIRFAKFFIIIFYERKFIRESYETMFRVIRIKNFLNSAIYFRNFASPWFLPWWTEYLNPNFSQSLPLNIVIVVSSALSPKSSDFGPPQRSRLPLGSFRNRCWRFIKFGALFRKYFEQQLRKRWKFLEYTKRAIES